MTSEEGLCSDGIDNDEDGDADCSDSDCASDDRCIEGDDPSECVDGIDNDGDGLTDCADGGCAADGRCIEGDDPSECSDGVDNDGDGLTDCADGDCDGVDACVEGDRYIECSDGIDNDGDGLVDCLDSDCAIYVICDDWTIDGTYEGSIESVVTFWDFGWFSSSDDCDGLLDIEIDRSVPGSPITGGGTCSTGGDTFVVSITGDFGDTSGESIAAFGTITFRSDDVESTTTWSGTWLREGLSGTFSGSDPTDYEGDFSVERVD